MQEEASRNVPCQLPRHSVSCDGAIPASPAPFQLPQYRASCSGTVPAAPCRNWLSGFGTGLVGGRGINPLTFQLLCGSLRDHRRGRGRLAEITVDQSEGHPGVRCGWAVDGAPGGEGRQGLLEAGSLFAGQQVAGWDNHAVRTGAEPPLDELVEAGEIRHHFQTGVRDEEVYACSGSRHSSTVPSTNSFSCAEECTIER